MITHVVYVTTTKRLFARLQHTTFGIIDQPMTACSDEECVKFHYMSVLSLQSLQVEVWRWISVKIGLNCFSAVQRTPSSFAAHMLNQSLQVNSGQLSDFPPDTQIYFKHHSLNFGPSLSDSVSLIDQFWFFLEYRQHLRFSQKNVIILQSYLRHKTSV